MGTEIIDLAIVTISLVVLVVLPFLPVSFFMLRREQWPAILLGAIVIGCGVQAAVGLLWTISFHRWPWGEVAALTALWLVLLAVTFRFRRTDGGPARELYESSHLPLILILAVGFALRLMHPIDVAFLGQSDAYTHLHYIRDIAARAHLVNPAYPAGFHWVLALPVLVFGVDPYLVARYGGAFFGVGMVLGVYVLLDRTIGRWTAIFGGFCAAAFPGMTLLMKTGVGVFANQFGLMMVPAVLLGYVLAAGSGTINRAWAGVLAAGLCGMAAAVPMMVLHLYIIFTGERLAAFLRRPRGWLKRSMLLILLVIPSGFLIFAHIGHLGPNQRVETADIVADAGNRKSQVVQAAADSVEQKAAHYSPALRRAAKSITGSPYFQLLLDFTSVKRLGFGNTGLDVIGGILAGMFAILLAYGFWRNRTVFLVIGIWGLLTSVQAGTGLLQFSAYQREGWSLLIATCCLCGIVAGRVYRVGSASRLFRFFVFAAMAASAVWSGLHPPAHLAIRSSAEDELIRTIRLLGLGVAAARNHCRKTRDTGCAAAALVADGVPLTVVTRRFIGWGNQGEIALKVIQPGSPVSVKALDGKEAQSAFAPGRQYVVLVDKDFKLSGWQLVSAFTMVNPAMMWATVHNVNQLFKINDAIVRRIEELPRDTWRVETVAVTDRLDAFVVRPNTVP